MTVAVPASSSLSPLVIHDLTVAYQRKPVVWDIDYSASAGRLIAIVGPNGAGKSTLIKAALSLVPRISGEILFFGQPYRQVRHRVAYVPQRTTVDWDFPSVPSMSWQWGCIAKSAGFVPSPANTASRRRRRSSASACRISQSGRSASFPAASSSACFSPGRLPRGRNYT